MPYKVSGKIVYVKRGGKWRKKAKAKTAQSAKRMVALLRSVKRRGRKQMEFKFRRGKIYKIENGVKTEISREEYKSGSNKKDWTPPETVTPPVTENGQDFVE